MRLLIFCVTMISAVFLFAVQNLSAQEYKGADFCLTCHSSPMGDKPAVGDWVKTYHNTSLRDPDSSSVYGPPGVVSRDQWVAGIDLATTSAFAKYGVNAPKLSVDTTALQDPTDLLSGYKVTIGDITYPVVMTYGGHGKWKQRYLTKIGESLYILPIQWNEKDKNWVTYHPDHWYGSDDLPLYTDETALTTDVVKKNSFERRCIGCHSTGVQLAYDETIGYTATYSELNTACEKCHGPGGPAISAHSAGTGVEFDTMTQDQKIDVCGQCHSRGESVATAGGNIFDFPVNAALELFKPGDTFTDFFSVYTPENSSKFWADGVHSKNHHQQALDFKRSVHYSNPWEEMDCTSCHDPHQAPGDHQIRDTVTEEGADGQPITITTNNDDNTLCLACHATHGPFAGITKEMVADAAANKAEIGAVVSQHTNHTYDPDGPTSTSRCSKCHMPKGMKSAVPNDIHSHTFQVVMPEETIKYKDAGGMFNSCALSCHNSFYNDGMVDDKTKWDEATDVELASDLHFQALLWWGEAVVLDCDLNSDGKRSIADAVTFLLIAQSDPTDARLDWNRDGKYDLADVVVLLKDLWTGNCPESSEGSAVLASASQKEAPFNLDALTLEQVSYLEQMMGQLDLTEEQEAEFRAILNGRAGRSELPKAFALAQNTPNPFNPATTISYSVPEGQTADVSLKVYDIRGRLVSTLVAEIKTAGTYTVFWDGINNAGQKVASGVYFYRLQAGEFTQTRKMVLLK